MNKNKKIEILTGSISISGKGVGYFKIPAPTLQPRSLEVGGPTESVGQKSREGESWEIQKEFLNHAFPGDTVEIKKKPELIYGRPQAEVVKVVSRTKMQFVGLLEKDPSGKSKDGYVVPDDRRMYVDVKIDSSRKIQESGMELGRIENGMKVLVKVIDWPEESETPIGEIVEVIGKAGENDTEMRAIALEKGFRTKFPDDCLREAEVLKVHASEMTEDVAERRDMRDTLTFTIDPADAKDFDDALSIRRIDNNIKDNSKIIYEIGIHIADVSHFVRPGTALDTEARKRALSVYLVDRTIPMLPEILSNDLCSLNPNEDKYTFSAVFHITNDGVVKDKWFGKTIIHSDKRFSYEEAQEVLDSGSGQYYEYLETLRSIAKIFEKKKFENGAINFETDEVKFVLDENGKPLSVYRKQRKDTHRLIEEYMLLANRSVAEYVFKSQYENPKRKGAQSVYRIHDVPDKERIEELATFVKALGFDLHHNNGEVTGRDISNLLHQIEGNPNEELIKTATIRSMAKAVYSTKNIGHFGLGFSFYAHFTSPIRRYPDLVVHRLLERELKEGKIEQDEFEFYEKISMECSEREKQAADAERGSIKYKQVEYMQEHVGKIFQGTITGITDWGVYVEEKETKCEGMAKVKDIGTTFDDFFTMNPKTYSMSGEKTGKKITLGDTVTFKVVSADLEKRMLDYSIME